MGWVTCSSEFCHQIPTDLFGGGGVSRVLEFLGSQKKFSSVTSSGEGWQKIFWGVPIFFFPVSLPVGGSQIFFLSKFFFVQIFFCSNFFLSKFFWVQIFLVQIFFVQICFVQICFYPNFFCSKFFFVQIFLSKPFFFNFFFFFSNFFFSIFFCFWIWPCGGTGGTPLVVTQEDCLVKFTFLSTISNHFDINKKLLSTNWWK